MDWTTSPLDEAESTIRDARAASSLADSVGDKLLSPSPRPRKFQIAATVKMMVNGTTSTKPIKAVVNGICFRFFILCAA